MGFFHALYDRMFDWCAFEVAIALGSPPRVYIKRKPQRPALPRAVARVRRPERRQEDYPRG